MGNIPSLADEKAAYLEAKGQNCTCYYEYFQQTGDAFNLLNPAGIYCPSLFYDPLTGEGCQLYVSRLLEVMYSAAPFSTLVLPTRCYSVPVWLTPSAVPVNNSSGG